MAGLNLISTYSSESDNSEDDKDKNNKSDVSSNRLPLPESIATWKGVVHHEDVVDDPLLHEGRIRNFKHERGNWASLIYLDYTPNQAMTEWMSSVVNEVPVKCNINTGQLHVSLSRTLILKFHWIESFVDGLKQLCTSTDQFKLELLNVQTYCNDEQTRTFLGIECFDSDGTLTRFIKNLNDFLTGYGLQPYYEDFSCHVSFLWCLGDKRDCLNDVATSLTNGLNKFLVENVDDRYIYVDKIHFKTGNQLYAFKLK